MHNLFDILWSLHPFEHFVDFCSSLIVVLTCAGLIYRPTRKKFQDASKDKKNIKHIEADKEEFKKRLEAMEKRVEIQELAEVTLLHDSLYKECRRSLKDGFTTFSSLDNIEHLYEVYKKLGGNGTGTLLVEKVKNLPVKTDIWDLDEKQEEH